MGHFVQQTQNSLSSGGTSVSAPQITTSAGDLLVIVAYLQNIDLGTLAITDTGGGNTYQNPSITAIQQLAKTLTGSLLSGATSATLSATWPSQSGTYTVTFSDGETRAVTFTISSAAISWTGGLTNGVTANINVTFGATLALFYAYNINGAQTTLKASISGGGNSTLQGIYAAEYSGITSSSNPFISAIGAYKSGPGIGANTLTSGALSGISAASLIFGFVSDLGGGVTTVATPGTSPVSFTGRTAVWSTINGNSTSAAVPEDADVSANQAATWGAASGNQFDAFVMLAAAFTDAPPQPLVGQPIPTTGGTGNLSGGNNSMIWALFRAYASGTATALNIYISGHTATTIFLGLYDAVSGALLASGSATIANGLNTISIPNISITYGKTYALAWQSGNTSSLTVVDDGTNNMCFFGANTAGSLPATLPAPQSPTNLGVPSFYVSGVLSPGASGTPLGGPARVQTHYRSSGGLS